MAVKNPQDGGMVKQVRQYLHLMGWPVWRSQAGKLILPAAGGAKRRAVVLGEAGLPDVMFVCPGGRLGCAECKSAAGKLRPAQEAWLETARKQGALCCTVRSLDDLRQALRAAGYDCP